MSFLYFITRIFITINIKLYLCDCARILAVFPIPSISHQSVFRPLTQELAKRGHEVVVITTDPAFPKGKTPKYLTEIDVHDISYKVWRQHEAVMDDRTGFHSQYEFMFNLHTLVIDEQFKNEEVKKIINNVYGNFDLLLIEACVNPILAFTRFYNVPVIQISSYGALFTNYETVGTLTNPTIYSSIMNQRIYNLSIWEKVKELRNHFMFQRFFRDQAEVDKQMLKSHVPFEIATFDDLKINVDMLFINIHPCWEEYQPVPVNVVYMSGIHQEPQKLLPEDLQTFLDSSLNGVIYFSFGSNILPSLLPKKTIEVFMKVLSQLPYNVLLKWDNEELPEKSTNIKVSKWFPQIDLLKHPNVKLFITQAGLQSTEEAIAAGVPLIGLPLMMDQWYNSEKYVHNKIGLQLDTTTITEEEFRNAIVTVIEHDSYRNNIMKLRSLMDDQPQKPLSRVVWWTEYVLRYGGERHLRTLAANMPWTEYYEIELLIILSFSILFFLCITMFVIYKTCNILRYRFGLIFNFYLK